MNKLPINICLLWLFNLIIISSFILIDQLTKHHFQMLIPENSQLPIFSFFSLIHIYNKGAAFSILNDGYFWQTSFLLLVSVIAILYFFYELYKEKTFSLRLFALLFILGGAFGNLIDRYMIGAVFDFILFHYRSYYFPAFNLADTFISIGAFLYILDYLLLKKFDTVNTQ